jgi:hypothetical protein
MRRVAHGIVAVVDRRAALSRASLDAGFEEEWAVSSSEIIGGALCYFLATQFRPFRAGSKLALFIHSFAD